MVQCEMCGTETASPKTVKVEGAELDVCDQCSDFGTEVQTESSNSTSTKYSTSSSDSSSGGSTGTSASGGSSSSGGSRRQSDMFDDMGEIAQDYDERIRTAREAKGLSQAELAKELNEKASLIRKLERGKTLPTDDIEEKLERFLDVDLSGSSDVDESEWDGGSSSGEYTLGDMVERKD